MEPITEAPAATPSLTTLKLRVAEAKDRLKAAADHLETLENVYVESGRGDALDNLEEARGEYDLAREKHVDARRAVAVAQQARAAKKAGA